MPAIAEPTAAETADNSPYAAEEMVNPGDELLEGATFPETDAAAIGDDEDAPELEKKPAAAEEPEKTEAPEKPEAKGGEEIPTDWPESAKKRVDQLTARRGEAERARDAAVAERDAAKQELESLKSRGADAPAVPASIPGDPLGAIRDERTLDQHVSLNTRILDWTDDHRDGGEMPADLVAILTGDEKAEARDYTADQVRELRGRAREVARAIPQRRAFLQTAAQAETVLREQYPAYFDESTEEGKTYAAFKKQMPWLPSVVAAWPMALADTTRGYLARMADAKAEPPEKGAAKPASKTEPPVAPVPPGTSSAPARPAATKPKSAPVLSASMTAEELAALDD